MSDLFMNYKKMFLLILLIVSTGLLYSNNTRHKVLYINSYHPGYKWSDDIYRGIREVLVENNDNDIELRVEYLDGKNYDQAMSGKLGPFIEKVWFEKYKNNQIEAIIVSDQLAYNFVQKIRKKLFPEVIVFFSGVEKYSLNDSLTYGMATSTDIEGNIQLIKKILPKTKRLWIITDQSLTGRINRLKAESANRKLKHQIELSFFETGQGISEEMLIKKIKTLPKNEPIFFLDYYIDDKYRSVEISDILSKICKVSTAPVFSHVDLYLSYGVTGGKMNSGYLLGKQEARLVYECIINGVHPPTSMLKDRSQPIFQYDKLKKYGINLRYLPEDAHIIGFKENLFIKYLPYLIMIIAFIIIETCLIFWLSILYKKLKISEYTFKKIVESLPLSVGIADLQGKINYINPEFKRVFEYDLEEIQDIESWGLKAYPEEEYRKAVYQIWNEDILWASKNPDCITPNRLIQMCNKNNNKLDVELSFTVIKEQIFAFFNEITNEKQAERALKANEELFKNIFNLLPYSCVISNLDDSYFMVNRQYCLKLSMNESEIVGKSSSDIGVQFDSEHALEIKKNILQYGEVNDETVLIKYPNSNEWEYVLFSSKLVEINGVNRIISAFIDITDRVVSQKMLVENEKRIRQQKDSIINIILNRDISLERIDKHFASITEILANTMNTARVSIWKTNEDQKNFECLHLYDQKNNCHSEGETLNPEDLPLYWQTIHEDNRICVDDTSTDTRVVNIFEKYLKPLGITSLLDVGIFNEGKLIGILSFEHTGFCRQWLADEESFANTASALIGVIFVTLEKIKKDKIILEKNQEMEQILYVASHDLRSPLVNVDGYGREIEYSLKTVEELLKQENESKGLLEFDKLFFEIEDMNQSVSRIRTCAKQMNNLLSGLLKISRTGRIPLKLDKVNMNEIFRRIISINDYQIKLHDAEIILDGLPDCYADEIQLSQVFTNLLTNSLKFKCNTRKLLITITGRVDKAYAIYSFKDNGIGIAKEHQLKIFELFHRLNPDQFEGEGIGLCIVKLIINRLNGIIQVNSDTDNGTEFIISLPYKEK